MPTCGFESDYVKDRRRLFPSKRFLLHTVPSHQEFTGTALRVPLMKRKKRCANPLSSCEWIDGEIAWQQAGGAQLYWSELEKENKTVVVASGFLVCFLSISPLIVGGNGKITGACWHFLTITNKNSATNCREGASRWGERALEYYSPRTWWEETPGVLHGVFSFFLFFVVLFIEQQYNLSVRNHLGSAWRTFIETQTGFDLFICTSLS